MIVQLCGSPWGQNKMGAHLLRQRGEGVVVLIGEELQLEQDGARGHG